MNDSNARSHSARVRLTLRIGGQLVDVAQVARDFLILRDRVTCSENEGTLIVAIDDHVTESTIILPDGLTEESEKVSYW